MLSKEHLIELYGGLPSEETVIVHQSGWCIDTPTIKVEGEGSLPVFIQGGVHSEYAQLSHKVRCFVRGGYPVICLSQSGAATVEQRSPNFYKVGDYSRFVARDVAILDKFNADRVIAYGSSIGAGAAIALAAEHPERVAAVIAVNPASLISQSPWGLALRFFFSTLQTVEKDFEPPLTSPIPLREVVKEIFGEVVRLAASDVGLSYLERVQCPVLIFTGDDDHVFRGRELTVLNQLPNVQVIPMVNFIHSDPNSREKMDRLFMLANRKISQLGIT